MVKNILFLITVLALGCSVTNNKNSTQKSIDFKSIHIDRNGSFSGYISSSETAELCKTFILNRSEIVTFFKHSRIATPREYAHELTASNCYASGSFITSAGAEGTWKIDRARRGLIHFKKSTHTKYYYCVECKSKLFYESCDIECIHGQ